jgi:hypothetical protein
MARTSSRLLRQDQGEPGIDRGSQLANIRAPQSSSQHHSIADGDVVDRHQMSIDAGRAVLFVACGISTGATFHAKAVVVGILLIFRN